eukprot:149153-Chlamydomonas_euryale.AAC.1
MGRPGGRGEEGASRTMQQSKAVCETQGAAGGGRAALVYLLHLPERMCLSCTPILHDNSCIERSLASTSGPLTCAGRAFNVTVADS